MKNIKGKCLEKYNSDQFTEIAHSVFKNKLENNYCFAFEAELEENEEQYPLDDLLNQYNVSCTEYYENEEILDGIKKTIREVETISDSKNDLIKILNFSTIVGRTIENVVYCGSVLLVLKYGMGKIKLNDAEILTPILAYRNDRAGMMNFEIIYPEIQYNRMFEEGINGSDLLPQNCKMEFILLEKGKAFVIFKDNEETYKLVYGLKGYEQTEKIERYK